MIFDNNNEIEFFKTVSQFSNNIYPYKTITYTDANTEELYSYKYEDIRNKEELHKIKTKISIELAKNILNNMVFEKIIDPMSFSSYYLYKHSILTDKERNDFNKKIFLYKQEIAALKQELEIEKNKSL